VHPLPRGSILIVLQCVALQLLDEVAHFRPLTAREGGDLDQALHGTLALSRAEMGSLDRSQFVTGSQKHRDPRFLPYAFTEHGAIMAATTLNSSRAVEMSVHVVRAFVRLRGFFISNHALAEKFDELERRVGSHEEAIAGILRAPRELMTPPDSKRRGIGFTADL
jgi:hypothetical protein